MTILDTDIRISGLRYLDQLGGSENIPMSARELKRGGPELPLNGRHCNNMPRYQFHIVDGAQVFDALVLVLPDNAAARRRAVELATNLGKANLADLTTKAIKVANNEGAVLFSVPIRSA